MNITSLVLVAAEAHAGAAPAPGGWGVTSDGVLDLLAAAALLVGIFFMLVGALGVLRLPDAYHRLHAASKCTTLGLTGMLIATMLHVDSLAVVGKSAIVIVFTFVAAPIGSHMLAKAAHLVGLPMWERTGEDQLAADKASGDRSRGGWEGERTAEKASCEKCVCSSAA